MAERQWTVVWVPHGAGESRSVRVSVRGFRILVAVLAVVAIATVGLAYSTVSRAIDLSRLDRLDRRNELLAQELHQAQQLITSLTDTVAVLARRDQQIRLLAGLNPTDPDVQLAGIGGPAAPWTEQEYILSEGVAGRRALAIRSDLDNLLRRANLLAGSFNQAAESLEVHVDLLGRTPSIWPISPTLGWMTSRFSDARMHPIFHEERPHEGIDISASLNTPILAPANGRVRDIRWDAGYGNVLTIHHGNDVVTLYAHCSKILVTVGQRVSRGEKIALVGKTGYATAPHLHYEVIERGKPQNPRLYIISPEVIVD